MNKNYQLRDKIIFGENIPKYIDICHFNNLNLKQLEQLINYNFIELDEYQNNSPTTQEIYDFMKKYPDYIAHGYVVTINRNDYRTTLEGIEKYNKFMSLQEERDFYELFSQADDLVIEDFYIYCWYD